MERISNIITIGAIVLSPVRSLNGEGVGIVKEGPACGDVVNSIPPTNRVYVVDYFKKGERQMVHDAYDFGPSSECGGADLPDLINPVVVESGETEGALVLGEPYNNGVVKDGGVVRCPSGSESATLKPVTKSEEIETLPVTSLLRNDGTSRVVLYIPHSVASGLHLQEYNTECTLRVGGPINGRPYRALVDKK